MGSSIPIEGNTALGQSSPANPARLKNEPSSITIASGESSTVPNVSSRRCSSNPRESRPAHTHTHTQKCINSYTLDIHAEASTHTNTSDDISQGPHSHKFSPHGHNDVCSGKLDVPSSCSRLTSSSSARRCISGKCSAPLHAATFSSAIRFCTRRSYAPDPF